MSFQAIYNPSGKFSNEHSQKHVYLGIDVGSRNTKLVAYEGVLNEILHYGISETGVKPKLTVESLLKQALSLLQLTEKSISKIYTTGYGRKLFEADMAVSEIRCHAKGVLFNYPDVSTIIDIGGQDSKLISLNERKQIKDFIMNDKCAAGTGKFLEMVALLLGVNCKDMSYLASVSTNIRHITNTCVVFAESEIIGMIAEGISASDIARAVNISVSERIVAGLNQLDWKPPIAFTGGVALNSDLCYVLSNQIGHHIQIPHNPLITGALGAAIIAASDNE